MRRLSCSAEAACVKLRVDGSLAMDVARRVGDGFFMFARLLEDEMRCDAIWCMPDAMDSYIPARCDGEENGKDDGIGSFVTRLSRMISTSARWHHTHHVTNGCGTCTSTSWVLLVSKTNSAPTPARLNICRSALKVPAERIVRPGEALRRARRARRRVRS